MDARALPRKQINKNKGAIVPAHTVHVGGARSSIGGAERFAASI